MRAWILKQGWDQGAQEVKSLMTTGFLVSFATSFCEGVFSGCCFDSCADTKTSLWGDFSSVCSRTLQVPPVLSQVLYYFLAQGFHSWQVMQNPTLYPPIAGAGFLEHDIQFFSPMAYWLEGSTFLVPLRDKTVTSGSWIYVRIQSQLLTVYKEPRTGPLPTAVRLGLTPT